jgi:Spy/CpxP family protein refolding chaperone
MHPGFISWWQRRHAAEYPYAYSGRGCGGRRGWESGSFRAGGGAEEEPPFGFGGAFGVRRPLRFLAHRLGLEEKQVSELARILNDLKTERAQAAVDYRRTLTAFADAIAGESFDAARVREGAGERVRSAEHLRDAVVSALERLHGILTPEQRSRLAYLIRTGALTI